MSNFVEQIAAEVQNTILRYVLPQVEKRIEVAAKESFVFCYTEEEAAAKLNCSAQTLAHKRKNGEIGHSHNPAGRPVYMAHHLLDYLQRQERRTAGKAEVTLTDVLTGEKSAVIEFPRRRIG